MLLFAQVLPAPVGGDLRMRALQLVNRLKRSRRFAQSSSLQAMLAVNSTGAKLSAKSAARALALALTREATDRPAACSSLAVAGCGGQKSKSRRLRLPDFPRLSPTALGERLAATDSTRDDIIQLTFIICPPRADGQGELWSRCELRLGAAHTGSHTGCGGFSGQLSADATAADKPETNIARQSDVILRAQLTAARRPRR